MDNENIIQTKNRDLSIIDRHIQITNNLLAEHDIFNEMLNLETIRKAAELAISARKLLDQFYDKNEIEGINLDFLIQKVFNRIQNGLFDQKKLYSISLPKNRIQSREHDYYDLPSYTIRFLISYIIYKRVQISNCVFGGKDEIFIQQSNEIDIYKQHNEAFWSWQKKQILKNEFEWVYIADIEKYYNSISTSKLASILESRYNITSPRFLKAFEECFTDISLGCWCDHFVQNIYLTNLDQRLSLIDNIEYARLTDDIRIFCKTESDCEKVHVIVQETLNELNLKLNKDKQFVLHPIEFYKTDDWPKYEGEENYNNWKHHQTHPSRFSHYIRIDDIDKYEIENILKITLGSHDHYWWCNPKYEQNKLPKKLTLKTLLEGDSGFKLGEYDLNLFLDRVENGPTASITEDDIFKLTLVIKYSYMNYKFYYRVIKIYFYLLIIDNLEEDKIKNRWDKLIESIGYTCGDNWYDYKSTTHGDDKYKTYIFLKILFSQIRHREITFYEWLTKKIHIKTSIGGIIVEIFTGKYEYISSEILFLMHSGTMNDIKFNEQVFWSSIPFWQSVIGRIEELESLPALRLLIDNILKALPDSTEIMEEDAYISLNECRFEEAYKKYKHLHKIGHTISLFQLAYCCAKLGQITEAIEYYSSHLKTSPDCSAFNNRALLYMNSKEFDKALKDFNLAIKLSPDDESYYRNRSILHSRMDNHGLAADDIETSFNLCKNPDLIKQKSYILIKANKVEEAKFEITRYCDLENYSLEARNQAINQLLKSVPFPKN